MAERHVKLLLVEDDPDDVWMMRNLLGDRWDEPFDMVHVELLSAAVERLAEESYDIILLDLTLPDSRGLETFFAMHAQAGETPIVVLSGCDDEQIAVKAVQAGAQDYLVKGQVNDRILVRSIRYAIERGRRRRAEEAVRDTSEEFRAAREIQRRLYPAKPPDLPGFEIAGALFSAKSTAGDYFDYIPMLDGCLGVVLGDVSSHGMGPALLMSETRACLRTLAEIHGDVGEILTRANRLLAADASDQHFITLAMARLDPRDRSMVYASAGQRGYLLHPGLDVTVLDSTSLPLGVRAETVVPAAASIALQPGDLLTFFTDGVVEAESPGRVRFGVARALQAIRSERDKPPREIIEALHQEILGFCRNQPLRDDVTVVIVKVTDSFRGP
ncbi:MAG: fused response regulator/phosphatase [Planctomycetes bacterium]|nr:fused response regulator/phosphatase [Planctomycetota bacterium]MBU4398586.1 fused response regulator/phosphatase [Planctomycetota bacterium]MCG2685638.1 fused response regulator/phosphatase [Planctomycetales bacterium]